MTLEHVMESYRKNRLVVRNKWLTCCYGLWSVYLQRDNDSPQSLIDTMDLQEALRVLTARDSSSIVEDSGAEWSDEAIEAYAGSASYNPWEYSRCIEVMKRIRNDYEIRLYARQKRIAELEATGPMGEMES